MVEVQVHDVLCGRGGGTNKHEGNREFRKIVADHQPTYLTTERKKDKRLIAQNIVNIVKGKGGRFLIRNSEKDEWQVVEDERAREKASQALREGQKMRRRSKSSTPNKKQKMEGSPLKISTTGDQNEKDSNFTKPPTSSTDPFSAQAQIPAPSQGENETTTDQASSIKEESPQPASSIAQTTESSVPVSDSTEQATSTPESNSDEMNGSAQESPKKSSLEPEIKSTYNPTNESEPAPDKTGIENSTPTPETETKPKVETTLEPKTVPKSETEPKTNLKIKPETKSESEAEPNLETSQQQKVEAKTENETKKEKDSDESEVVTVVASKLGDLVDKAKILETHPLKES